MLAFTKKYVYNQAEKIKGKIRLKKLILDNDIPFQK